MKFTKYLELSEKTKLGEMPLRKADFIGIDDPKTGKNTGKGKAKRYRSNDDGDTFERDDGAKGPELKDKKASKGNSFNKPKDRRVLDSPGFVKKLHKKLGNSDLPFNIIVVNTKEAKDYTEVGAVTPEWIEDNLGIEGYVPEEDDINIFYTNNDGAQQVLNSPWILMHRFSHAIVASGRSGKETSDSYQHKEFRTQFIKTISEICENLYGMGITPTKDGWVDPKDTKKWNALMNAILTMKSARDNKIERPNEVFHELVAQHITTKKRVTFNPFPDVLKIGKQGPSYRSKDSEDARQDIEMLSRDINEYIIPDMLGTTYGSTYVM